MILTRDVSDLLFADLQRRQKIIEGMGYTVKAIHGAWHWAAFMDQHGGQKYVAFDDDETSPYYHADDMFGLMVDDVAGRNVAAIIMRDCGDTSIHALVNSGRLWWHPVAAWDRSCGSILPAQAMPIDGRILHQGGLLVLPDHRGRGIGGHLAHMIRLIGFRTFDCEHATGLEPVDQINADMHRKVYGYAAAYPVANGLDIRGKGPESMWLTHISRVEVVKRLRTEQ